MWDYECYVIQWVSIDNPMFLLLYNAGIMASINEINTTADCSFDVNNFVDNLLDQEVHFQVLKMKESFFVWIGSAAAKMEGLAVAMTTNIVSIDLYG